MLNEFFVQACEEISLITAFGIFLITGVYTFFQWKKGKKFVADGGYADTSLSDYEKYDLSQSVSDDIINEKVLLKPEADSDSPARSKEESLLIPSSELTYPEMLSEAIGRRNYSAVGRMADRGLTTAQIANELGIPKGEVNLVLKLKGLYGGGYNTALPLEATFRAAS